MRERERFEGRGGGTDGAVGVSLSLRSTRRRGRPFHPLTQPPRQHAGACLLNDGDGAACRAVGRFPQVTRQRGTAGSHPHQKKKTHALRSRPSSKSQPSSGSSLARLAMSVLYQLGVSWKRRAAGVGQEGGRCGRERRRRRGPLAVCGVCGPAVPRGRRPSCPCPCSLSLSLTYHVPPRRVRP
mgnify:CR=1 FL=1